MANLSRIDLQKTAIVASKQKKSYNSESTLMFEIPVVPRQKPARNFFNSHGCDKNYQSFQIWTISKKDLICLGLCSSNNIVCFSVDNNGLFAKHETSSISEAFL